MLRRVWVLALLVGCQKPPEAPVAPVPSPQPAEPTAAAAAVPTEATAAGGAVMPSVDRKSTRLNSSH